MKITAEEFEKATGQKPENDDLARANCDIAGTLGHRDCGWDTSKNLPTFMVPVAEREAK
jgi:hypothetical protein